MRTDLLTQLVQPINTWALPIREVWQCPARPMLTLTNQHAVMGSDKQDIFPWWCCSC